MPRKEWVAKNKFRKRSRLVEHDFIVLVNCYCTELLSDYSRKECYSFYRSLLPGNDIVDRSKYLSFVSFNNILNEISQYLWDNLVVDLHPLLQEEDVFDDLLDLIYGKIDKISSYREVYDSLDRPPFCVTADSMSGSLIFYLLSRRSKVVRGFKKGSFYLEFSRVTFLCAVIELEKIELPSIYSIQDLDIEIQINKQAFFILMELFEKKPL